MPVSEAATKSCSILKVLSKVSQNSDQNVGVFFDKTAERRATNLLKEIARQVLIFDFFIIFQNTFFTEHLHTAASAEPD